jgi:periplasmic protein TonB
MSSSALPLPLPPGAAPTLQRRDPAAPRPVPPAAPSPPQPAPRATPRPTRPQTDLAPAERCWLIAGMAVLHLALLWGLLQMGAVRQTLRDVAPLMVSFIRLETPPLPAPAPPSPQAQRPPPARPAPLPVVVAAATPQAPPAPTAFVAPDPMPVQTMPTAQAAPTPAPAVAAAAPATVAIAAAAPKPVAATALRYALLPPVELPLVSRRLGESGTVLLRVVFDTQGRVKQASVHRSSGFARLDDQALAAMRQARITPFLDNGIAIEVSAIAPLAYELD